MIFVAVGHSPDFRFLGATWERVLAGLEGQGKYGRGCSEDSSYFEGQPSSGRLGHLPTGMAGVLFQPRPSRSAAEATDANGAGSAALIAASSRLRWRAMAACRSAGSVASSSSSMA